MYKIEQKPHLLYNVKIDFGEIYKEKNLAL